MPETARHGSRVAWSIMIGCGATELLYNIAHAVRGVTGAHDWVGIGLAVLYGMAAVTVSVLASHMATARRPVWEILVFLAVILAAMGMSAGAVAAVIRPVAGPVLCWVFPATLDTATLMAFRFIVVPEPASRGRRWWTKTVGGKPATKPAASRPPKPPQAGSGPELPPVPGTLTLSDASSRRKLMREAWDAKLAEGKIATGGDLNRAIGEKSTYSLGKKWQSKWKSELPDDHPALQAAGGGS